MSQVEHSLFDCEVTYVAPAHFILLLWFWLKFALQLP